MVTTNDERKGAATKATRGTAARRTSIWTSTAAPRRSSIAQKGGTKARRTSRVSGRGTTRTGGTGEGGTGHTPVILDGVDVTPKPMLSLKPSAVGKGAQQVSAGHSDPASEVSGDQYHERMSSTGFSRSGYYSRDGSTGSASPDHGEDGGLSTPRAGDGSEAEDDVGDARAAPAAARAADAVAEELKLTEQDLDRPVKLTLCETETFWLLHVPSRCVAMDSAEATAVEEANERYRTKLKEREGSESFVDATMQTLNSMMKQKEVQAHTLAKVSEGCQANAWDIADATDDAEEEDIGADSGTTAVTAAAAVGPAASLKTSQAGGGSVMDSARGGDAKAESAAADSSGAAASSTLDRFAGLATGLSFMEKAVVQNVYHDYLLVFRNFKPRENVSLVPELEEGEQALVPLWEFACEATTGRNVACMAWNRMNKDLLAVGYGEFEFMDQKDGLIAFWSLKNPKAPEWTFTTPFGVTALDFSATNPNLLAVGLYDGTVSVYDVREPCVKPVLESGHTGGKHSDPVWKLRWVQRGSDQGESLVSISTDGRVTQWSIKKGLEYTDLMKLKRVANARGGGAKSEAFISRRSSGMCFDFCPHDTSLYVAGTEDGNIHKCSCSYSEQYLESYFGHSGPVYAIEWSPFQSNLFLSASADWTIKLWKEDHDTPTALLTFQSGNEEVTDMSWSPTNSTVFGTVTKDGRVEVWDLNASTLRPVLTQSTSEKLSCMLFSEASPVLVTGGSSGAVTAYRLVGVEKPEDAPQVQAKRLEEAMESNIAAL